jgi:uncharacterized protein (TIGR02391 family)
MSETPLRKLLPDLEALFSFPVEELAWLLLRAVQEVQQGGFVALQSFIEETKYWQDLERFRLGEASLALSEAWAWLLNNGLLVQAPGQSDCYKITTRLADRLKDDAQIDAYRKSKLLNRNLLHPIIAERAWPTFLRGDYDTAVFQSFKEVEVAVRDAAGLSAKDIGTAMMRRAFDKNDGPLTDASLPEGEREALAHLFAGAIGSYKNPSSHRTVADIDTQEAAQMMILASHLLSIVDHRRTLIKSDL